MLRHLSLPALLTLTCAQAPDAEPPVRELGQVEWNEGADGLERAKMLSAIDKKPVFLLFQEIPGCATCRNFGDGPLSHPLLVEAIETLFHPAAVHNNRGGADARVLKEFNEPSWNNPVVRFVDAMGDDILPRRDRVWTTAGIAQRAVQALEKKKLEVPAWLALVEQETSEERPAIATFSMHCFWEGEVHLGAVDGVTQVRAGWLDGREVVEATYLPSRVALVDLTKAAKASGCATRVHVRTDAEAQEVRAAGVANVVVSNERARDAQDSDHFKRLRRTNYAKLELTPLQQVRINAALGKRQSARRFLTPSQQAQLKKIEESK